MKPSNYNRTMGALLAGGVGVVSSTAAAAGPVKAPVRVATTTAGTLASSFENGDTVDGITLATGDRILVKDQSAGTENGIYLVAASGAPQRATDMDSGGEILGSLVPVLAGTANGGKVFHNTNTSAIVVGTTAITFEAFGPLTVEDEGTPLATPATTLNFVGAGVTASGTGATKTITISGAVANLDDIGDVDAPSPADRQVLGWNAPSGTWQAQSVGQHAHVVGEPFIGDASLTVFYLANEAEADTVAAYDVNGARVAITQDATELDKITFTSAPAAGQGWFDYLPATG